MWRRVSRIKRLTSAAISTMGAVMLIGYTTNGWQRAVPSEAAPCFLLGDVIPSEGGSESGRVCESGAPRGSARPCLRRARVTLGHTPRLAIIGDSRARAIYYSILQHNITGPARIVWQKSQIDNASAGFTIFSPGFEPRQFCAKDMCSGNATSELVEVQYFWRPFADRHLSQTLDALAAECDTARDTAQDTARDTGGCPDTVLVNSGLWYSERIPYMYPYGQHEQLVMFRRGLLQLVAPLTRLARRTFTVWKLEEAVLYEFVRDKAERTPLKTGYMELVLVQQALVYEITRQVPSLTVWSSLLPEVTRHMFHVCARGPTEGWPECPDTVHMGKSLQDSFSYTLLRSLCHRVGTVR